MLLSFHYHSHLFLVFVQSEDGHYETVLSSLEVSPGLSFSQHWLLCALLCSLVLLTMLLLRACACGWGGGEGTSPSPSRLITANERTPWRSILASRNLQYALSCCTLYTHSYNLQYHVVHCTASCSLLEQAWCRFWRCCLLVCLDTAAPY